MKSGHIRPALASEKMRKGPSFFGFIDRVRDNETSARAWVKHCLKEHLPMAPMIIKRGSIFYD